KIELGELDHDEVNGEGLTKVLIGAVKGPDQYQIIDDETVSAGGKDIYTITVTFTVDPAEVATESAECGEYSPVTPGSGLLNVAVVSDGDRKGTRLNSSHMQTPYAAIC